MNNRFSSRLVAAIAMTFTLLVVCGIGTLPGFAANTTDTGFSFHFNNQKRFDEIDGWRSKTNTTKIYLNIKSNNVPSDIKFLAWGAKNSNGDHAKELTATYVKPLRAFATGKYSLSNNIREQGYGYAKVEAYLLERIDREASMSGVWSPDSTKNYNILSADSEY